MFLLVRRHVKINQNCTSYRRRHPLYPLLLAASIFCASLPFQTTWCSLVAILSPCYRFPPLRRVTDSNCSAPPTLRILLRPQLTAASAAGRSTRSEGKCSPLFLQQSAGGARRSETQGGRRGGETVSAPRILRRRSSNSRLHQQAGPGLPEGDEGIAGELRREA